MNKVLSLPVAFAACCGMPFLAACTRTPDGSVIVHPVGVPGFLRPAFTAQPVSPPVYPIASQFPPSPTPPTIGVRARPPATRVPVLVAGVKPPFERSNPQRPLACRNENTPTGRIRIVCD